MRILDATASVQSMWYQKNYKDTVYFDKRNGRYYENHDVGEHFIKPNVQGVWMNLPFRDNKFDMVIFDPPHIFKIDNTKKLPQMSARYGIFYHDTWKNEIERGVQELFRVLKNDGTFILKWAYDKDRKTEMKPLEEVIKLFPYPPVFGTRTGIGNSWIVFLKHRQEKQLSEFE